MSFKINFHDVPRKQWIKFAVSSLCLLLFAVWLFNFWVLLVLPFLFDLYISHIIPWGWWKNIKNKRVRSIFSWIDAIVFALVAVYFINLYLFQNYKIPSSSLEKTLLVGDHLFVSKVAYGPRTPNTPFSFPLVQHTFPFFNCKSYIGSIQWKSRRLAGLGNVERNDIVVFNFPGGDTVCAKDQAEDYEGICFRVGKDKLQNQGVDIAALYKKGADVRSLCIAAGRKIVLADNQTYGEILYRPVDRRENYVKRCVGLPGDWLAVRHRELYINGKKQSRQPGVQHYCVVETTQPLTQEIYDNLEISHEYSDRAMIAPPINGIFVYAIPLTLENQKDLRRVPFVKKVEEHSISDLTQGREQTTFPAGYNPKWTVDDYGPIYIPKAGVTFALNVKNLPVYERVIRNYEGNKLEVRNGKIYINGKLSNSYKFKMDYYWMMGDNRHNSADSRIWGFVPEDHIVGKPIFIWLSLNKDKGWFDGKIRWNRFFKYAGH